MLPQPRESRFTAHVVLTWPLLLLLRARSVDVPALVRRCGLRLGTVTGADGRILLSQVHALWRAGVEAVPDPALGLLVADQFDPQATFSWPAPLSLHEHLASMSATLRGGIERQAKIMRLFTLQVIDHRTRQQLEALPALDDFVEIVRERITAELPHGNTNASWVAGKLSMSPRTLHRRLHAEGTSYQQLLDQVRCRLATRHLASRKQSINQVALLVGFTQPSAFHRAFKAWTGETPADYQERSAAHGSVSVTPPRRTTG